MIVVYLQDSVVFKDDNINCIFMKDTGKLVSLASETGVLSMRGIDIDIGCDSSYAGGLLRFDPLDYKKTWELPIVLTSGSAESSFAFKGFSEDSDALYTVYTKDSLRLKVIYKLQHTIGFYFTHALI
jgi:hypothetical protein